MGMLMRRHYDNDYKAEVGANIAPPMPTPKKATKPEVVEVKETVVKEEPEKKITKGDIMKMNVATVRAYAEKQGIEGANAMSGAELKRILGNKLFEESE